MNRSRGAVRVLAAVLAAVAATTIAQIPAQATAPHGTDRTGSYVSGQGRLDYQVHLPPSWSPQRRMPVMVAIHGCAMSGYGLNSMKATTRFDDLADREDFIVVYPTQSLLRNVTQCWNSLSPEHQHRGRGEPELITGAVRNVVAAYGADSARVHVSGASSGAGTAVILGVTYPDVYATVTSVAGGEYALQEADPEHPDAVGPADTARLAHAEMGPRARPVPLLVVQGDRDTTVPPFLADRLVQQGLAVADLARDGRLDVEPPVAPTATIRTVPGGDLHPYTRSTWATPGGGGTLVEEYLVEGQGHAWSGPRGSGLFTDRMGPDLAALAWSFAAPRSR